MQNVPNYIPLSFVDKKFMPKSEIVKTFNMPVNTLFTNIKNCDLILSAEEIGLPVSHSQSQKGKFK